MNYARQIGRTARQCEWCPEMVIVDPYRPGKYLRASDGYRHLDSWNNTRQHLPTLRGCRGCGAVFYDDATHRHICGEPSDPYVAAGTGERSGSVIPESPPVSTRLEMSAEDLIP